jgi:glycerophosphoryl diester phosphodiesterase
MNFRGKNVFYSGWLLVVAVGWSIFAATPAFSSSFCGVFLQQKIRPKVVRALEQSVNTAFAIIPQPQPNLAQLRACQIVSHRGAHDRATENTLQAFELCRNQNVWGIEFDLRWTKDDEPIVLHDADAGRTFGRYDIRPRDLTLAELKATLPALPTLQQMVEHFGERFHLMIELKEPITPLRQEKLVQLLSRLDAVGNYHFLSLKPELFAPISLFPNQSLLIVSELNAAPMSRIALEKNWGGITGHYLLLDSNIQARHQAQGQAVGTGFVDSRNSLYRAISRGVKWVFTNKPLEIAPLLGP